MHVSSVEGDVNVDEANSDKDFSSLKYVNFLMLQLLWMNKQCLIRIFMLFMHQARLKNYKFRHSH